MNSRPEHERLFDEISSKLNELSFLSNTKPNNNIDVTQDAGTRQEMLEKMQGQIRRFQSDLQVAQDELRDKIKNLENVQYQQTDISHQMRLLSEQLNNERNANSKLNTDLAKSLELSLQLQLEIQGLKARAQQNQQEEKKYSQSLVEKMKSLQNEADLQKALKEETDLELDKAKASFLKQQDSWIEEKKQFQIQISSISSSFEELEESARKQNEVLKNLMETAETKIIEIKMALDRKTLECADYYSHLQQSLTQSSLLKSENQNLKEHIEKINQYIQQTQNISEGN